MKTKKVYNFNMPRVKKRLVKLFKERKNEASISDLIADSALPSLQVQEGVKVVLKEYRGHMKVTESGELLYYFPRGMKNHEKGLGPGLKKAFSAVLTGLKKFFTLLFKIWIMVMLIGYFAVFVAILVGAIALTLAASFAGNKNSSRSSKGGGGFYLVIKVIELFTRIWFYNSLLEGNSGYSRGNIRYKTAKGPKRPLHKAVFAYVFGPDDPNKDWEQKETRYLLAYIRAHKGIITREEVMASTGKTPEEAQQIINNFLIRFEGEPEVTEEGTIIYSFPQLLKTANKQALRNYMLPEEIEDKAALVFSGNPRKTDKWLTFFNGFNILFSGYFFYFALNTPVVSDNLNLLFRNIDLSILYKLTHYMVSFLTSADPAGIIVIALGIIPFLFSLLFYTVSFIRSRQMSLKNETIKKDNLKKKIYTHILTQPGKVNPAEIIYTTPEEKLPGSKDYIKKTIEQFAAIKEADVTKGELGGYNYNFKELAREKKDVEEHRKKIDLSRFELGETIFDSGE